MTERKGASMTTPAPAPASLRDMTEADFDKAHGIAPAGVPDVASVALEEFTEWLCREMPSGTIIGEPKWWAPRIFRAAHPAPAPASLRDMTEADFDKAHGIAPAEHTAAEKNPEQPSATHVAESQALALSESSDAGIAPRRDGGGPEGVPDVAGLTHKLLYWARSSAENRPQAADAMREAADALAALQSQLNLRIAHGWIADAAGRQQDEKITQQAERIITLEAKLAEAVGLLDAVEPNSCIDVNGVNWYDARQAFFIKVREVLK